MSKKKDQGWRLKPLTDEEVQEALKSSGFPLEVRLLKALADADMSPNIGFRVAAEGEASREMDVTASLFRYFPVGPNRIMGITMLLLIEAKGFPTNGDFVGLSWTQPDQAEMRWARSYFGGAPSSRVLSRGPVPGEFLTLDDGLGAAFDGLNNAAYCVQWACAQRKEDHVNANHEPDFAKGIDTVVRSSHSMMHDDTVHLTAFNRRHRSDGTQQFTMRFIMPVLVVAPRDPRVFDPVTDSVSAVPRLVLSRWFEAGRDENGRPLVHHRLVDVVAEGALPDFIKECKNAMNELEKRAKSHAEALQRVAEQQSTEKDA